MKRIQWEILLKDCWRNERPDGFYALVLELRDRFRDRVFHLISRWVVSVWSRVLRLLYELDILLDIAMPCMMQQGAEFQ
jgi:hypothetical protein